MPGDKSVQAWLCWCFRQIPGRIKCRESPSPRINIDPRRDRNGGITPRFSCPWKAPRLSQSCPAVFGRPTGFAERRSPDASDVTSLLRPAFQVDRRAARLVAIKPHLSERYLTHRDTSTSLRGRQNAQERVICCVGNESRKDVLNFVSGMADGRANGDPPLE